MSNTKFTPGPWRHETSSNFGNIVSGQSGNKFYDGDDGFRAIATVQSCCSSNNYKDEEENMRANINLIAVAPEIYELLYKISKGAVSFDLDLLNEIDAVLAKARGEAK